MKKKEQVTEIIFDTVDVINKSLDEAKEMIINTTKNMILEQRKNYK